MASNLDTLLELVPESGRPLVRFGAFCLLVAGVTLGAAHWINAQASERVERRVRPLEAQLIQIGAVAEATFVGQEEMRLKADPHASPRNLKAIKKAALEAALRAAQEQRQIEDGAIQISTPGGE